MTIAKISLHWILRWILIAKCKLLFYYYDAKTNLFTIFAIQNICQLGYRSPLANCNPKIFYVPPPPPPDTDKLTSPPRQIKALIIPTCCACLTITLILISEQPTNTSYFLVTLFKWFKNQNVTKLNINWLFW